MTDLHRSPRRPLSAARADDRTVGRTVGRIDGGPDGGSVDVGRRRLAQRLAATAGVAALGTLHGGAARAQVAGSPRLVEVARGLEHPWSLAFLPDGRLLVTERPGRLRVVAPSGEVGPPVGGTPRVQPRGQGGLLEVLPGRDFARDRSVFLSCAEPTERGARTAVFRGELVDGALRNLRRIWAQRDDPSGAHHFGCRLAWARDGTLFVTTGDRFSERDRAQDLGSALGKVIRIDADGGIPADNPLLKTAGALPEIWSWGHRNLQGAAIHPQTGELWTHEHGPQGGDELNRVLAGRNYGWPAITTGREYVTGLRIGEGTARADVEAPVAAWSPSIAPSGLCFVTGTRYPRWSGSVLIGSLKFRLLVRVELDGTRAVREERLFAELGERIRDVRQGPDGFVYLVTDAPDGRILRVETA